MPPSNVTTPSNIIIAERLEGLRQEMQEFRRTNADDLRDLKISNAELAAAVRTLAETYKVEHVKVLKDVAALERRMDVIDDPKDGKLTKLINEVQPLIFANRIMVWVFVSLGVSVIALIFSILTHQVTLVFP